MLRGGHLLQAIQLCYRVYLKTYSEPNKTTARAALGQIVTSPVARLEMRSTKLFKGSKDQKTVEGGGDNDAEDKDTEDAPDTPYYL